MAPGILNIVIKSVRYYRKPVLYQILIVALLSSVITGSLLTGWSVRASLKRLSSEHLGNTGILISSGTRYFAPSLAERLRDSARLSCTGLLELNGFCQNFKTQKEISHVHIYGITDTFFRFQGNDTLYLNHGEVAVNEKLAGSLDLYPGDELIIRFNAISDIPLDAPFAPAGEEGRSLVLKVGSILKPANSSNFSLLINQVIPDNIFINLSDIGDNPGKTIKINRLLVDKKTNISEEEAYKILRKLMQPSDLGLKTIALKSTDGLELRSERVFLDNTLIQEVKNLIPSSAPLLTYLGNSFSHGDRSAPYSFVAALPHSLYPDIAGGKYIIINRWLAEDLSISPGDTLNMSWYVPDSLNRLIEKSSAFPVKRVVEMEGIWGDSLLMPDFPGISGSESCSAWNAGVPVKLNLIRKKDEEYWNKFRGTPKAFLDYENGNELWGNNFGKATAIRFLPGTTDKEIWSKLAGHLDPVSNGFIISDLYHESMEAASNGVDFSTLFLSLGFFLILASVVLLSFAVSTFLESKHAQIRIYFALGFRSRRIKNLLFAETFLISVLGCFAGSFGGFLVCMTIIHMLNSVWQGAVQTDALSAFFSMRQILSGFLVTIFISVIFLYFKIRNHLKNLNFNKSLKHTQPSRKLNLAFLLGSFSLALPSYVLSRIITEDELILSFVSGALLLISMIFLCRQYLTGIPDRTSDKLNLRGNLSRLYYSYYPSHAVTPLLFIAAGIFAVFITGANRMSFEGSQLKPSGGTGGFLLWCESTIPLRAELRAESGISVLDQDDEQISGIHAVSLKRYAGDDASCLNLNHVKIPPLLGVDAEEFVTRGSFSFARSVKKENIGNPWQFLQLPPSGNTIYGIADQTVLEWGLGIKPGDTLVMRSENGQKLNIIIAAGLRSSVFQGYLLIGLENFKKYFPSVPGSSVLLIDGNKKSAELYETILNDRLGNYGIKIEKTNARLASFYEVTNTYLSVFGVFGALGMIIGIAGLGFILLRNYNYRKREFGLMLATGFTLKKIKKLILSEQIIILAAGMISGILPAIIATLPSLRSSTDIPWIYLMCMVIMIFSSGLIALFISLRSVTGNSLSASLRKD